LVDPYQGEKALLFDLQIPNSTSSDYYKFSGEVVNLAEIEAY
jgi:hypothetical protein